MPEYYILRELLGVTQLYVAYLIWKKDVGYVLAFGVHSFLCGAYNIAPTHPYNELYKYLVQLPTWAVCLCLMIGATLEIFAFMYRCTFPQERKLLLACSIITGMMPVAAGWLWHPSNLNQLLMLISQYICIVVAVAFWVAWVAIHNTQFHTRLLPIGRGLETHGRIWGTWLILAAIMSTTCKGGLMWQITPWDNGLNTWRVINGAVMFLQTGLMIRVSINLQRWKSSFSPVL